MLPNLSRVVTWLGTLLGSYALLMTNPAATAAEIIQRTLVYKQVEQLPIKLDVQYQPSTQPRPVVVWIHGGALINGHRASVPAWIPAAFVSRGYAVVSIDYRLAPETKLPEIIADVEDAFRWIRAQGPQEFAADPQRIAVIGGSAGGYLTLVAGYRVQPRPTVLVSLWGYGDLVGEWYNTPSPHARHHQSRLTAAEARAQVQGPPVADSRERRGDGGAFYQFCRREGIWPREVSGWDPRSEREKFVPFMPEHNVTREYPPTLLIHGDADTDVPFHLSETMARLLKQHGVEQRLRKFPGAEHGLAGADPAEVSAAYAEAAEFVVRRLD